MGILFVDGFDHYTAIPGTAGAKWNSSVGSTHFSIGPSYARYSSGGGLRVNDNLGSIGKGGFGQLGTWYFGFAYYKQTTGAWAEVLWTLMDLTDRQIYGRLSQSGSVFEFARGAWNNSSTVYTCPIVTAEKTWYYFEFKV